MNTGGSRDPLNEAQCCCKRQRPVIVAISPVHWTLRREKSKLPPGTHQVYNGFVTNSQFAQVFSMHRNQYIYILYNLSNSFNRSLVIGVFGSAMDEVGALNTQYF